MVTDGWMSPDSVPVRHRHRRVPVVRRRLGQHPVHVADLRDLTSDQVAYWQALYDRFGTRVQQSPAYARAASWAGERLLVAMSPDAMALFTHNSTTCTALGSDQPFLGTHQPSAAQLVSVVLAARQATGLSVYLPLIDAAYADVAGHSEFTTWDRPPNSLIDWTLQGRDLWARARSRGTSQLDRKRRLVERDGLVLDIGRFGEEAARDMLAVDDRSWKATRGQSMRQRASQWALYGRLVESGTLTATFLRNRDQPVAFRLDGRVGDRVMCLKWSYDESYRRYSPGLYLLTEGLTRQWSDRGVSVVDLFGSPDSLKNLLHTHRRSRIDVWCGDTRLGEELARDRLVLDTRVARASEEGKGLRHAFE